jgi:mono/diheme cytochrome c family protein
MRSFFSIVLVATATTLPAIAVNEAHGASNAEVAAKAHAILKANCSECHSGQRAMADVTILDRKSLVSKEKIAPGSPDKSLIIQLVTAADDRRMPPEGKPRLSTEQIDALKAWIAAGAPPFPGEAGVEVAKDLLGVGKDLLGNEAVLTSILKDVRGLAEADRKFARYFSIAHRQHAGADK